tara:strand:- start:177 stop:1091 length:915 start_codon:yes stop_codon:yes gene_type:complete
MTNLLSLNSISFYDLKQKLRREIYEELNINQEESKSKLLFKMLFLSSRPSNFFSSEENFILINLLQDLISNRMEYEAAPLFEKLAQLNRDSDSYDEYYNLFRKHFNIKQSTQRCLSLFMHLNGKIGEYNDDPCIEYIKQIDRTFLEIKNIQNFNDNPITSILINLSLTLITLFCKDSKYAFTKNKALLSTFLAAYNKINNLPQGIERFYLENITFYCSVQLNHLSIKDIDTAYIIEKICSQKVRSVHYNFNFSKEIAEKLIHINIEENKGAIIIDFKQHRSVFNNKEKTPMYNSKNLYKTTALS